LARRIVAEHDLSMLARAASVVAAVKPQEALAGTGIKVNLPAATRLDQWFIAFKLAKRGYRLAELLSVIVDTTSSPWDPRTSFLRTQIGKPSRSNRIFPVHASVMNDLRTFRDEAREESLVAAFRQDALHAISSRF